MHALMSEAEVAAEAAPPAHRLHVTDARRVLEWVAALAALAGGLVHLAQIRHHLPYPTIAVAFAAMGVAQLSFFALLTWRPARWLPWMGLALHSAITLTWVLSRTVGLGSLDGASGRLEVGVADAAATAMSVAVVGASLRLIAMARRRERPGLVPIAVARVVIAAVAVVTLGAAIPAAAAGHDHEHDDHAPLHSHDDGGIDHHGHG